MSPRTPDQNERIRAASRERILEAALRLFAEHGYERTSVKMIAAAAGISQGLLYNYFAGKDALLAAIFEASMDDVRASFAAAEEEADPRRRIAGLVRGSVAVVRGNLAFWRLSYALRMQAGVMEGLGARTPEWTAAILATLERYLREAGVDDPGLEAAVLFATIDGVSQHYALDPGRYPLDAVAERIIGRYDRIIADAAAPSE